LYAILIRLIRVIAFSTFTLSLIIGAAVLIPRLSGSVSPLQTRLADCEPRCTWEAISVQGWTIGDMVLTFGAPSQVVFADTGWRPGLPNIAPYFAESLYYPSRRLVIVINNYENPRYISPQTSHGITIRTLAQMPIVTLDWHGFASLCRYLSYLIDQCAAF